MITGVTGTVAINGDGDRKPDYNIAILQDGRFVNLLTWFAANEALVKVYGHTDVEDDWQGIVWPGGSMQVPTGQPQCGWLNEKCTQQGTSLPYL